MNSAVNEKNREEYARLLQGLEVKDIFLAVDRRLFFMRGVQRDTYLASLQENIEFFEDGGYSVGVWLQAFGFGEPLEGDAAKEARNYTVLRSVSGRSLEGRDAFCPEDDGFVRDYCKTLTDIARLGARMIMLDDDLCMSVRPGIGCFCHTHISIMEKELGEKLPADGLKEFFFTGGKNKYRDAWRKVMGDTHRRFAKRVREAVDSVDKTIRVGFCAGYTSWDIEGVSADELARLLAGETKPFLRLTGAPYWASRAQNRFENQPLGAVIECARSQYSRCAPDIEVFSEADSYPRPRYIVPASLIECFSVALCPFEGLSELSYLFDYFSSPVYERGYIKQRLANKELYEFIEKNFWGKDICGARVVDNREKIACAHLSEKLTEKQIMRGFFNRGAELMATLGIPTVYGESEVTVAVGEDARYIDTDRSGKKLVTDAYGARILSERGIDMGYSEMTEASSPTIEYFGEEKILLSGAGGEGYYSFSLSNGASALSFFEIGGKKIPSAYTYKSGNTEMLVYTFDIQSIPHLSAVLLSYERGRQLADFCEPVAYLGDAPGVYQICMQRDGEYALLFVNISEDPIIDGVVGLSRDFARAELCGASGELCGRELRLTSTVPSYGAFAALLK